MPAPTNTQKATPYRASMISQIASGTDNSRPRVIRLGRLSSSQIEPACRAIARTAVGSGPGVISGTMRGLSSALARGRRAGAREAPGLLAGGIAADQVETGLGEARLQLIDAADIFDLDRRLLQR